MKTQFIRMLSLFLCVVMVFGILPAFPSTASAAETDVITPLKNLMNGAQFNSDFNTPADSSETGIPGWYFYGGPKNYSNVALVNRGEGNNCLEWTISPEQEYNDLVTGLYSEAIPVSDYQGQGLFFHLEAMSTLAQRNDLMLYIRFYKDEAGTSINGDYPFNDFHYTENGEPDGNQGEVNLGSLISNEWAAVSSVDYSDDRGAIAVVPSDANYCRIFLYRTAGNTGTVYLDNLVVNASACIRWISGDEDEAGAGYVWTHTYDGKKPSAHIFRADCNGTLYYVQCDSCEFPCLKDDAAYCVEVGVPTHSKLVYVAPKASTATQDGNIAYWECVDCGGLIADNEGEIGTDIIPEKAAVMLPRPVSASDNQIVVNHSFEDGLYGWTRWYGTNENVGITTVDDRNVLTYFAADTSVHSKLVDITGWTKLVACMDYMAVSGSAQIYVLFFDEYGTEIQQLKKSETVNGMWATLTLNVSQIPANAKYVAVAPFRYQDNAEIYYDNIQLYNPSAYSTSAQENFENVTVAMLTAKEQLNSQKWVKSSNGSWSVASIDGNSVLKLVPPTYSGSNKISQFLSPAIDIRNLDSVTASLDVMCGAKCGFALFTYKMEDGVLVQSLRSNGSSSVMWNPDATTGGTGTGNEWVTITETFMVAKDGEESAALIPSDTEYVRLAIYHMNNAAGADTDTLYFDNFMMNGNCSHNFTEIAHEKYLKTGATCTEAETYYKSCACGALSDETFVIGDALGHEFNEATCDAPATCHYCGVTQGEALKHVIKTFEAKNATCEVAGITEGQICVCCYTVLTPQQIGEDAHGHSEMNAPANCVSPERCAFCEKPVEGGQETLGHSEIILPANCTKPERCSACETPVEGGQQALGHQWNEGAVTQKPTSDAVGIFTYTCVACNVTRTEDIPKLLGSGTCGEALTWELDQDYTLTISGTGAMYHYTVNDVPWMDFRKSIASIVIDEGVTSIGNYAFYRLDGITGVTIPNSITAIGEGAFYSCGNLLSVTISDHVATIGYFAFGNCQKLSAITVSAGNKKYSSDSQGILYNKNKSTLVQVPCAIESCIIPGSVTTIDYYAFTGIQKLATLIIPGSVKTVRAYAFYNTSNIDSVTFCGSEDQWKAISMGTQNNTLLIASRSYHRGVNGVVTAPTCTENGYTTYTCELCGEMFKTDVVKADGHNYQGVVTAPDCTKEGYTTYSCSVCGHSYTDNKVAANGHKYDGVVTEPTCTTEGYTTFTCSVCGDTYVGEKVPAKDHTYQLEVTAPDCTTGGYTTYTCTECGYRYVGDKVSANGHVYDKVVTKPTCTDGGYTTYTCAVCKHSYVGDKVNALGHAYKAVVTEPTCTDKGYTTYRCARCELSYQDDVVAETGHKYETVVIKPTCSEYGYTSHACTACGDNYITDKVAPVAHTDNAVVTDPTCTQAGYTTYTCTLCGNVRTGNAVPAVHSNPGEICKLCGRYGVCGEHLTWSLNESGVMTISGTGAMKNFANDASVPWYKLRDSITSVVIGDGVTTICKFAFVECFELVNVTFGRNITVIDDLAFSGCSSLTDLLLYNRISKIGNYAFAYCTGLKNVRFCGTEQEWKAVSIGIANEPLPSIVSAYHDFDKGVITLAPTSRVPGIMTYTCNTCGAKVEKEIAATGVVKDNTLVYRNDGALNLEAFIGVQFSVAKEIGRKYDRVYIEIMHNENVVTIDLVNNGNVYFAEYGLAAKEMADQIDVQLYAERGETTYSGELIQDWSIKSKLVGMLDRYYPWMSYGGTYVTTSNLAAAMLVYGAEAQKLFGYNEDNLVTDGVKAEYLALVPKTTPIMEVMPSFDYEGYQAALYNPAFILDDVIKASLTFAIGDKNIQNYKARVTINGVTKDYDLNQYVSNGITYPGYAYIIIDSIVAADLRQDFSVTIMKGNTPVSGVYTFSMENMAAKLMISRTDIITAIMNYSDAAHARFRLQ